MSGVQISVRLDPELLRRLDAAAEERVVGRGLLIGRLLERGLDQLGPVSDMWVDDRPGGG